MKQTTRYITIAGLSLSLLLTLSTGTNAAGDLRDGSCLTDPSAAAATSDESSAAETSAEPAAATSDESSAPSPSTTCPNPTCPNNGIRPLDGTSKQVSQPETAPGQNTNPGQQRGRGARAQSRQERPCEPTNRCKMR